MKRATSGSKPVGKAKIAAPTKQTAEMPQKAQGRQTGPKHISIDTLLNYRLQGHTYPEIAKLVSCSPENVQQRLSLIDIEGFENYKKAPDVSLERFCYQYISLIGEPEIKNMIAKRGMTDFGIAMDKVREIRGQNDSNVKPMIVIVKGDNAQVQVNQPAGPKVDKAVDNPSHQPSTLIPSALCKP